MIPIISLLVVVTVSILITRVATVALVHTGLGREAARFQARSAFTGAGFTTAESEKVVNHPVRRRVVLILMLLGNAGIVSAVSSLILTFVNQDDGSGRLGLKIVLLIAGLVLLWAVAASSWVDRHLSRWIGGALKRYSNLDVKDYASLMQLKGDYQLTELSIEPDDWVANRPLREAHLRDEGIVVLGIHRRDGNYLGAPDGETRIFPDDTLILYGRGSAIEELDRRKRSAVGDREHEQAVSEQKKIVEEEVKQDEAAADEERGPGRMSASPGS